MSRAHALPPLRLAAPPPCCLLGSSCFPLLLLLLDLTIVIAVAGAAVTRSHTPIPSVLRYGTYVQPGRAEATADVPRLPNTPTPSVEVAAILRDLQLCAKR